MVCQRFTVNVTSLCPFRWRNGHMYFCGPTIPWKGIGKEIFEEKTNKLSEVYINLMILLGIEKNSLLEVYW